MDHLFPPFFTTPDHLRFWVDRHPARHELFTRKQCSPRHWQAGVLEEFQKLALNGMVAKAVDYGVVRRGGEGPVVGHPRARRLRLAEQQSPALRL